MTISGIGQNMLMSAMYKMQPLSASDMASRIMKKLNTNGDGSLSTEEISNGGERAKKILEADTNNDGFVTLDELISKITKDIESGEIGQNMPPNASDMASRIMKELDTNGDGLVSKDELIAGITKEIESRKAATTSTSDVSSDINQLKNLIAQMSSILSDQTSQSGSDAISQILSQMNLSDKESKTILEIMQNAGINTIA